MEGEAFTSPDQKDDFVTSLTSFVRLYDEHAHHLRTASEDFTWAAAQLYDGVQAVVTGVGILLGGVCGAVSGGVLGALNADIDPIISFVSSIFGGIVGGALGAAIGTVVDISAETTGSLVDDLFGDVVSFNIGLVTGGAIGGVFRGAKGGAIGGALGALFSTRYTVGLLGGVFGRFYRTKDSEGKKRFLEMTPVREAERMNFIREALKPLVNELQTIKTICDTMGPSDLLQSVAVQTTNSLVFVTKMEETISDSQKATALLQFVAIVKEAARRSERVIEELGTTRTTVGTFLVSLEKTQ